MRPQGIDSQWNRHISEGGDIVIEEFYLFAVALRIPGEFPSLGGNLRCYFI